MSTDHTAAPPATSASNTTSNLETRPPPPSSFASMDTIRPGPASTSIDTIRPPPASASMDTVRPPPTSMDAIRPSAASSATSRPAPFNPQTTRLPPPTSFTTTIPSIIRAPPPATRPPPPSTFLTPAPVRDAGKTLTQSSWRITTHKYPILNASEIDALTDKIGLTPPEMIFGNNSVTLTHVPSGWNISFTAGEALDVVDKTGADMLKVAYSEQWGRMREKVAEEIRGVVRPFDWTYSTAYKGTVSGGKGLEVDAEAEIPFEMLKKRDPILLYEDVMLYEDELADNGIAMLSVKVRVMAERLLLLQRFFLRLDDVVIRIRDTRVYVDFKTGEVVREYVAKEMGYAECKKEFGMYPQDDIPSLLREPNNLVDILPVVETVRERVLVQ